MSNIVYSGKVKIKLMRKNVVYKEIEDHNSGEKPLFRFLAYCVAGNYDANNVPKFLRLFDENENELTSFPVPYNSVNVKLVEDSYYNTTLSFLVPFTSIDRTKGDIKQLRLYNSTNMGQDQIAYPSAIFTLAEPLVVDEVSNITIDWIMSLKNDESEE